MSYDTLLIEKNGPVTKVILNRPEVHNAMNEQLMVELTTFFKTISNDSNTRIIVLTGNGKSFCAGADLNWMKSMVHYSKEDNIRDSNLLLNLYDTIYNCPKPVIGLINGHAFGGGLGLIAVCDITIGIPHKKYAFSEANLGIIPSVISTFVAPRMTIANMRRLFITAERFDSQTAHNLGILDILVEKEELDTTIDTIIETLSLSGPHAIHECKKLLQNLQSMDSTTFKKHTVEKIAELRVSTEGQEGISAFLEKRKPTWKE